MDETLFKPELPSQHGAEHDLLLRAVSVPWDGQSAGIRELVQRGPDWEYLFKIARRHSLLPLLFQRLHQAASDLVPNDELQRLRIAYQQNAARNVVMVNELSELVAALKKNGIEAIPYKGPVLAQLAYGDPSLRRFIDLDLMVKRRDVLAAAEVLKAAGFSATGGLSIDQQALLLKTQHNLQFTQDQGRLLVELHWQVSPHLFASTVTAEELWNNLESVSINKAVFKTFSADDLLFSLCVHGSRHLWERLAWSCDVAHLINVRRDIQWQSLMDRATRAQAERMFLLGVYLAAALLNAPLPDVVKQWVKCDRRIPELAQGIVNRLFNGTEQQSATTWQIFRYNFRVRSSLSARARYLVFMFKPTDSDLNSMKLPRPFRLAYYLARPFRVLGDRRGKKFEGKTTSETSPTTTR